MRLEHLIHKRRCLARKIKRLEVQLTRLNRKIKRAKRPTIRENPIQPPI
jgi:hypothetical protein